MLNDPGFLGTNATMLADLTLLAYVLILLPLMITGFVFARRKKFEPNHKYVMTAITLFNWVLIIFVMAVSYSDSVAPQLPDGLSDRNYLLPTLHLITGGIAQLLATYLVLNMWFDLPKPLQLRKIKLPMRLTLGLWIATVLLGMTIYLTWYTVEVAEAEDVPAPLTTEEPSESVSEEETPAPIVTEEAMDEPTTTEEAPDPATTEEAS